MSRNIIAIGGLKNSGKDTVSEMVQYLLNSPKLFHNYLSYKCLRNLFKFGKYKITSFANPLKQTLSALLHIAPDKFDDRRFKEAYYIFFPTLEIRSNLPKYANTISDGKFNRLLRNKDFSFIKTNWISIRQLLQVFGTECMRGIFGDNLWILATLKNDDNLVISDLRFIAEYKFLKNENSNIIYVNRDSCSPGAHASEKEIYDLYKSNAFSNVIDNNGSLKNLFNSVKSTIYKIQNKPMS